MLHTFNILSRNFIFISSKGNLRSPSWLNRYYFEKDCAFLAKPKSEHFSQTIRIKYAKPNATRPSLIRVDVSGAKQELRG